jgi:hypothetical protein
MDYGVLDVYEKKVYLFDKSTWDLSGTVKLPKTAVVYNRFNFSYANGNVFLFNQDTREWIGYRIF